MNIMGYAGIVNIMTRLNVSIVSLMHGDLIVGNMQNMSDSNVDILKRSIGRLIHYK